jgi:hypothetical protein
MAALEGLIPPPYPTCCLRPCFSGSIILLCWLPRDMHMCEIYCIIHFVLL